MDARQTTTRPTGSAAAPPPPRARCRHARRAVAATVVAALALLATACYPQVDPNDPYVAVAYPANQITEHLGLVYGQGVDHEGVTQDLGLDLYAPPSTGEAKPLIVLVHGGSFCKGSRTSLANAAIGYARRGYVAATISYRLGPCNGNQLQNAVAAGSDGQLAIQWLRSQAVTYGIDVDRVAMVGTSAGGGIAQMAALDLDLTGGRHDGPESFNPTASVSTGATLSIGIDAGLVSPTSPVSPLMLHHYELDTVTGAGVAEVEQMDALWEGDGVASHTVIWEGSGHTASLSPNAQLFADDTARFLAAELDLVNAAAP